MQRSRFIALSVVLDGVFVNVAIVGAFFVRFTGELPEFNFSAYVALWPLITVIFLVSGYIYGLYEPERTENAWSVTRAVLQAVTLGTILVAAVAFFAGPQFFSFSRLVIVIAWVFESVALLGWRLAALHLTPIKWPAQRVLIVGTDEVARELASELAQRAEWGYRVVGLLARDAAEERMAAGEAFPVLGVAGDIAAIIEQYDVNRVIIASPMAQRESIEQIALTCDVRVEVVPELYEIFIGTVDSTVSDIPLMEITRTGAPAWFISAKRVADVVLAIMMLVALSPALLLVSLCILASMGWPIFFTQERVGKDLSSFTVMKFRTMIRDAEKDTGPVLAAEDDSRVTPLGRFLRRYRIDEVPQLVNILAGDMSFVGPRPERPEFVRTLVREVPSYRERFRAKPGVTGLAQVNGSYATTPERKLKYDLIYLYHQNLLMDVQILAETVRVVLTGRGAR
ncbi:MAG: sugar transferase [Coriobacteriia bacterium]|nr:sugar transferase [Coriobacteriia bacterium]